MTDVSLPKEEHICKGAFYQLSRIEKLIIWETSAKVLLDAFSAGTKRFLPSLRWLELIGPIFSDIRILVLALENCITPPPGSWLLGPEVTKLEYVLLDGVEAITPRLADELHK